MAEAAGEPRRRDRFQQPHEQPEFLRRPVRRVRSSENGEPGKSEPTDLPRVVKILKDANYSGYIVLEYEAAEEPYDAIPKHVEALRKVVTAARA